MPEGGTVYQTTVVVIIQATTTASVPSVMDQTEKFRAVH